MAVEPIRFRWAEPIGHLVAPWTVHFHIVGIMWPVLCGHRFQRSRGLPTRALLLDRIGDRQISDPGAVRIPVDVAAGRTHIPLDVVDLPPTPPLPHSSPH